MALIQYITQIHLAFGVISKLREECERTGMRKPLIVTDAGVRAAGVLDRALASLGDHPCAVFDQTPSNPTEAAVRAAVALLKKEGCLSTDFAWGKSAHPYSTNVRGKWEYPGAIGVSQRMP